MKISALDIVNHRFKRKLRGYDTNEVDIFLEMVAAEMEELAKENKFLTDELKRKSNQITDFLERENTLKETLIAAQKVAQDMKSNMVKEAQAILSEAELEGERLIKHAHQRAIQLQEDVQEIKKIRIHMENELRAIIKSYLTMLDAMAESESRNSQLDGKLTLIAAKVEEQ